MLLFIIFIQCIACFQYNKFYSNNFKDYRVDSFTIITSRNRHNYQLVKVLDLHKIDYLIIDIKELSIDEITNMKKYYNITYNVLTHPVIFKNNEDYIGSEFEMYELLFTKY